MKRCCNLMHQGVAATLTVHVSAGSMRGHVSMDETRLQGSRLNTPIAFSAAGSRPADMVSGGSFRATRVSSTCMAHKYSTDMQSPHKHLQPEELTRFAVAEPWRYMKALIGLVAHVMARCLCVSIETDSSPRTYPISSVSRCRGRRVLVHSPA